jgi:hypothetical protein
MFVLFYEFLISVQIDRIIDFKLKLNFKRKMKKIKKKKLQIEKQKMFSYFKSEIRTHDSTILKILITFKQTLP